MNLQSGQNLSLEELKQRNRLAYTVQAADPHPTQEDWEALMNTLWDISSLLEEQNRLLNQRLPSQWGSQMQALETSLARISWLLEQAGRKKEKRVWQWRWHLPDIHLGWGWLLPFPILTALWAIFYSLATILNALGMAAP